MKSTDSGESWFDPTDGEDPYFIELFFMNDILGYGAHGNGAGRLGVTMDGGLSCELNEEYGGQDLHFYGECSGGAIIGSRYFSTADCGENWNDDTLATVNRTWKTLWMQNSDTLFIGATGGFGTHYGFNYGSIGRSFDGGDTFYILDIPYTSTISDLFFTDDLTGYAGCSPFDGYQYSILKTIDGGETWGYQEIDMNPLFDDYSGIHEIDCPSPGFCYAVGGGIYRTTNGGGEVYEAWAEVGTSEAILEKVSLDVYPNPALSSISIANQKWKTGAEVQLHMYDVMGKMVLSRKVRYADPLEIDVSSLPAGTYAVDAACDGVHGVKWFVKE